MKSMIKHIMHMTHRKVLANIVTGCCCGIVALVGFLIVLYYLGTHMGPPSPTESAMIYLREHPAGFSQMSVEELRLGHKLPDQDFHDFLLCDSYWVKRLVLKNPYLTDSVVLSAFEKMDEKGLSDLLGAIDQTTGRRSLGQQLKGALKEKVKEFPCERTCKVSSDAVGRLRTGGVLSDEEVEEFLVNGDFAVRVFVFDNVNVETAQVRRVSEKASPQLLKALDSALRASCREGCFYDLIHGREKRPAVPVGWLVLELVREIVVQLAFAF